MVSPRLTTIIVGILSSIFYLEMLLCAKQNCSPPDYQVPAIFLPPEPPPYVPGPYDKDCWVGSSNFCWDWYEQYQV